MSEEKLQKLNFNKLDADKIMTRAKRFKQYGNFSKPKQDEVAWGAKIQDFSLLNERVSKAAFCATCKKVRSRFFKRMQEEKAWLNHCICLVVTVQAIQGFSLAKKS